MDILKEINKVRKDPNSFVSFLEEYLDNFTEDTLFIPGCNHGIMLEEGKNVIQEAIEYLRSHKGGLSPLSYNSLLEMAA